MNRNFDDWAGLIILIILIACVVIAMTLLYHYPTPTLIAMFSVWWIAYKLVK
jgi:hypothetical protein